MSQPGVGGMAKVITFNRGYGIPTVSALKFRPSHIGITLYAIYISFLCN